MRNLMASVLMLGSFLLGTANAADGKGREWCKAHPGQCAAVQENRKEMRDDRKEWCKAHPRKCELKKAKAKKAMDWCGENPVQCKKLRQKRKQSRQEFADWCQSNADDCAAAVDSWRARD